MSTNPSTQLRPLAPGLILAILAILFGFLLGGSFGMAESFIKNRLKSSADAVLETAYAGDGEVRDAVVAKSWTYLKRAHLHGGAIGTAALSSIVLLGLLGRVGLLERVSATAFGAGALIYPLFWLAAGLIAPSLGGTAAAKEALELMAILGAGLCLVGLGGTLVSAIRQLTARPTNPGQGATMRAL